MGTRIVGFYHEQERLAHVHAHLCLLVRQGDDERRVRDRLCFQGTRSRRLHVHANGKAVRACPFDLVGYDAIAAGRLLSRADDDISFAVCAHDRVSAAFSHFFQRFRHSRRIRSGDSFVWNSLYSGRYNLFSCGRRCGRMWKRHGRSASDTQGSSEQQAREYIHHQSPSNW